MLLQIRTYYDQEKWLVKLNAKQTELDKIGFPISCKKDILNSAKEFVNLSRYLKKQVF